MGKTVEIKIDLKTGQLIGFNPVNNIPIDELVLFTSGAKDVLQGDDYYSLKKIVLRWKMENPLEP